MNLALALDRIVALMRPAFPSPVEIIAYPGRFDLAELKAVAVKAPCICVAWIESEDSKSNSGYSLDTKFAAYIVTRPTKRTTGWQAGMVIATGLCAYLARMIPATTDSLGSPSSVAVRNLYARAIADEGAHLIMVTWSHVVDLADMDGPAVGDPMGSFQKFFADYDLAPLDPAEPPSASDHVLLAGAPE